MGNKLFFYEPNLYSFQSEIMGLGEDSTGSYALLTDSYFYPESGGQPSDVGSIDGAIITYVKEIENEVRHYFSGDLHLGTCLCQINEERRFDYMQQHTGQHILSAVFLEDLNGETSSFTIGDTYSTMEISIREFTEEQAYGILKRSNEIIMESIPVSTGIYSSQELDALPLRKKPSVTERIRVISIPPYDYSPCGGTHVNNTAQVGHIRIISWEKLKTTYRFLFVCGNRCIREELADTILLRKTSSLLSVATPEIPLTVTRLLEESRIKGKELELLEKKRAELHAQLLQSDISPEKRMLPMYIQLETESFEYCRLLCQKLSDLEFPLVAIGLSSPENGTDPILKIALNVAPSVPLNIGKAAKEWFELRNGKGGGGPKSAQGTIPVAELENFLQLFRKALDY